MTLTTGSPNYETDVVRIVHDNEHGTNIKIKPDSDGLGLVEVDGGADYGRVVVAPALALHVAAAIRACAIEMGATP